MLKYVFSVAVKNNTNSKRVAQINRPSRTMFGIESPVFPFFSYWFEKQKNSLQTLVKDPS